MNPTTAGGAGSPGVLLIDAETANPTPPSLVPTKESKPPGKIVPEAVMDCLEKITPPLLISRLYPVVESSMVNVYGMSTGRPLLRDRKSTRLNSSHLGIS